MQRNTHPRHLVAYLALIAVHIGVLLDGRATLVAVTVAAGIGLVVKWPSIRADIRGDDR